MNFEALEAIANAVLFEGYVLYPYRPSAIKNRQRWNFGTLYPRSFAQAQMPEERWRFSAQVLIEAGQQTRLSACVRFLQLVPPTGENGQEWQEGFARLRSFDEITMEELSNRVEHLFNLTDLSADESARAPGKFCERSRIGRLELFVQKIREGLYRLHAAVSNESPITQTNPTSRTLQDVAFTSAHLLLGLEQGAFVSLFEPQPELKAEGDACVQDGVFPVLAGEMGDRSRVLCSPIILYDYPQVAPESAGDFFDGTEMDEMLALRVLTLTDGEKAEMRRDPHARTILERTETLPEEQLRKLHGTLRELREVTEQAITIRDHERTDQWNPFAERPLLDSVHISGIELHKGDRVRIWPQKKADIMDMALAGKVAIIEAIEQDFEDKVQFALVLEDDPGRDMGMLRQAGHRFFFSPDEVEPLPWEAV
jgi:hypothetical protein